MSHEQPRGLDVIHRQTHTAKQDKCVQTHAHNIACTIIHFFFNTQQKLYRAFPELVSAAEIYRLPHLSVHQIKTASHVLWITRQNRSFLIDNATKGEVPASVFN